MNTISIHVKEKNLKKVLSVLEALKPELIESITQETVPKRKDSKPIKSSLDKIETRAPSIINPNKYLSKKSYQQKRQQEPILEDDFLTGQQRSGKYLNSNEYKKRLKK